jgi:hypothetical protein
MAIGYLGTLVDSIPSGSSETRPSVIFFCDGRVYRLSSPTGSYQPEKTPTSYYLFDQEKGVNLFVDRCQIGTVCRSQFTDPLTSKMYEVVSGSIVWESTPPVKEIKEWGNFEFAGSPSQTSPQSYQNIGFTRRVGGDINLTPQGDVLLNHLGRYLITCRTTFSNQSASTISALLDNPENPTRDFVVGEGPSPTQISESFLHDLLSAIPQEVLQQLPAGLISDLLRELVRQISPDILRLSPTVLAEILTEVLGRFRQELIDALYPPLLSEVQRGEPVEAFQPAIPSGLFANILGLIISIIIQILFTRNFVCRPRLVRRGSSDAVVVGSEDSAISYQPAAIGTIGGSMTTSTTFVNSQAPTRLGYQVLCRNIRQLNVFLTIEYLGA